MPRTKDNSIDREEDNTADMMLTAVDINNITPGKDSGVDSNGGFVAEL